MGLDAKWLRREKELMVDDVSFVRFWDSKVYRLDV